MASTNTIAVYLSIGGVLTELYVHLQEVGAVFREFEFVWDTEWLRWYVDGVVLFEEHIATTNLPGSTEHATENFTVEFEFSGLRSNSISTDAVNPKHLQIQKLRYSTSDIKDLSCRPRYRSDLTCQPKTRAYRAVHSCSKCAFMLTATL